MKKYVILGIIFLAILVSFGVVFQYHQVVAFALLVPALIELVFLILAVVVGIKLSKTEIVKRCVKKIRRRM